MKIGIFTECYKPTFNGVVTSIEAFRVQLEKEGHQVFIFCPGHKETQFQPNVFRVHSITLPSPKDYPLGFPYFSNLYPFCHRLNLEIIHTQHIFLMGGFGQGLAKKLNIPTLHTYHTMMTEYTHYLPLKFLRGLLKKFIILRSKNFCNRANKVIVPSSPIRDLLLGYGVKTKIEILPTGIDLKQFKKLNLNERQATFKKYNIDPKKKILLYVGRLAQEKNLDFLLECFKDVLKEFPSCHLVFVGSGHYLENLKSKISKLKIEKEVSFTGLLPKPLANQFFGSADLFVFPSTTETQGIVLTEAMASSTPAVAINQLGPTDIIKNGEDGFLVPLDKKEFSEKILILLKDEKLREKFGQRAKENVKRFSIESCTKRLVKIYQETIQEYKKVKAGNF